MSITSLAYSTPFAAPSFPAVSHLPESRQWVVTPLANGHHELKVWGKLPPRWLANLTGGLSARHISVQSGYANKLSPTVWQGTFEIIPTAGHPLPATFDYYELALNGGPMAAPTAVLLDAFQAELRDDALFVEVRGADSVGFLMSMLKLFAFYSLYPAEVSIDTPGGRVLDRFWLKGLGGAPPTAELAAALRLELGKLRVM